MTYTQEQFELAVKEAANFAYEQGKLEAFEKVTAFLNSVAQHPTRSLPVWTIALRVKELAND
jgi:hypothetical protein